MFSASTPRPILALCVTQVWHAHSAARVEEPVAKHSLEEVVCRVPRAVSASAEEVHVAVPDHDDVLLVRQRGDVEPRRFDAEEYALRRRRRVWRADRNFRAAKAARKQPAHVL